jgi:hypothetical protein
VSAVFRLSLGNADVNVIEGQVGFTASSDRNLKENFLPVDGEEVLGKIGELSLTSWNFIGHDPKQFRHYGPMAQDFFTAFGHDAIEAIGTNTTITSTDMDGILIIAVQALENRTEALRAENAELKARLEALERRMGRTKAEYRQQCSVRRRHGPPSQDYDRYTDSFRGRASLAAELRPLDSRSGSAHP